MANRHPPVGPIAAGRLTGKADSTPLLSGFSFGEFELRLQWSAAPGAAWKVLLPEVPNGKGLEIALCDGDRCGRCLDGDKEIAPGAKLEPLADKMHAAVLRRAGGKLTLTVDGRRMAEVEIAAQRRFGLGLAVAGGDASLDDLRIQEPAGEPIFNGKDLSGWWCPGNIKAWTVEDGQIVLSGSGGNYLRTDKEYANFTLALDYQTKKGCNSGIGIRTPRSGWPSGDGMELQIYDRPLGRARRQALANGHLRQRAAAGAGRPVGTVEPSGRQGRRPDDLRLGQRRTGAAVQHARPSGTEVPQPQGLDRHPGPRPVDSRARRARAFGARRPGPRCLASTPRQAGRSRR